MSEWQHLDGQFQGWTEGEAAQKCSRLFAVLAAFLKGGHMGEYTCSISWDLYNKHVTGRCREVFRNPYYLNLVQIVTRAIQFKSAEYSGQIHFVLDSGNSAEALAPDHFKRIKAFAQDGLGEHIGTLSFASDRDHPGLQAADVIAWYTRRMLAGIDPPDDFRRRHFGLLQDAAQTFAREHFTEEGLIGFNSRVNLLIGNLERAATGAPVSGDPYAVADYVGFRSDLSKVLEEDPKFLETAVHRRTTSKSKSKT